jgi:methionyl-tRNA synthetase
MPKMIDSDGYDRSTGDAIAGHIVAKMYRQDSDGHEQCRADLERVTAELEAAEKMIEVAQKAIAHYIEQIEAERDAMREVCEAARLACEYVGDQFPLRDLYAAVKEYCASIGHPTWPHAPIVTDVAALDAAEQPAEG